MDRLNKIYSKIKQWFLHAVMCCLGFHDWLMDNETIVKCNRTCRRCDKWQHSIYDMAYGDTYWIDGKYW